MNSKKRRRKNAFNENPGNSKNSDAPSNSLIHLVEQYNSDSDDDEPEPDTRQVLDKKVNDFFKEIQFITEQSKKPTDSREDNQSNVRPSKPSSTSERVPASSWQECYDESTGYPYYWHIETNEVTWEIPKELKDSRTACKYQNKTENTAAIQTPNVSRTVKTTDSSTNSNVVNEIIKTDNSRNKHKQQSDAGHSSKKSAKKKSKFKDKPGDGSDDSDEGTIEMITSFGDENSDSDRSDDEKDNDHEAQTSNSSKKVDTCESRSQELPNNNTYNKKVDDNKSEYQVNIKSEKSHGNQRVTNCPTVSNKPQEENTDDYKKESKSWCISGYTDNSDSDDNNHSRQPTAALFPSAFNKFRTGADHDLKAEKNTDQSEHSPNSEATEFSNIDETTQSSNKNNEIPKINRALENLGTAIKGFQRKRRIAFDVLTKTRGNDERLGLGFSKKSTFSDTDKTDYPNTSSANPYEEKKRNLGKYSIDFVKGGTIEVKNEIQKSENYIFTHQVQIIVEKLKILCEKNFNIPAAYVINIQLQCLLHAWESGDLSDHYFFNWLNETKTKISELEEAAAPPEWNYLWDKDQKKYYYKNKTTGEIQWSYPDIIGGAEEMEICTTPPAPSSPIHQEDMKPIETDVVFEKVQSTLEQSNNLTSEKNSTNNTNQNEMHEFDHSEKPVDKKSTDLENADAHNLIAPLPPRISVPSPPPPPRICADDLKKSGKSNTDGQSKNTTITTCKESANNVTDENDKKNKKTVAETTTSQSCEKLIPPTNSHLTVTNTSSHIEPLPPGVDQTESPYAITAAIESPVIFSTTPQSNASLYAAAIPNPTNISIIGHHPALVHNQIVHYPAVYQHLHDQAIIAAANRFTGPDAVQLMLHHPGIYANTQVISKPPVNMKKESLGSAVDLFYNDIASLESQAAANGKQEVKNTQTTVSQLPTQEAAPTVLKTETQAFSSSSPTTDNVVKEKKKKKVKIVINKKHKEVSSMVAKWKKAQNFQDIN